MADWVMVIVTTIYVIATIIMTIYNYKTYRISRKQYIEMKHQYEEQKRVNTMPYLQCFLF